MSELILTATILIGGILGVFILYSLADTLVPPFSRPRLNLVLKTLLFVAASLYTLTFPIQIMDGVIADTRGAIIAVATLFGGWLVGLATAGTMIALRLFHGGSGAMAGVVGIAVEYGALLVLLLVIQPRWQRTLATGSFPLLFAAALIVAVLEPLSLLLIPPFSLGAELFRETGYALGILQFLATVTLGMMLRYPLERSLMQKDLHTQQSQLDFQAQHDSLTGLGNRRSALERLHQALGVAVPSKDVLAVLFVDLDHFKRVNDTLGHTLGDHLLKTIAQRLQGCLEENQHPRDMLMRAGGDEFIIILENLRSPSAAAQIADRLIQILQEPIKLGPHELHLSASIGVSLYPHDGSNSETLLRNADTAMFRAKDRGRNTVQFYSEEMTSVARDRLALQGDLHRALEQDQLQVYYQPQVDLRSGTVVGVEALARWPHPERGMVPPSYFISIAEECGMIDKLGEWVLQTACRQGRKWVDAGLRIDSIAVNISGLQILRGNLLDTVERTLMASGLPSHCLELEVTETVLMEENDTIRLVLSELRRRGVSISIDDFGTGYSSLARLKRLPADKLKVDRSFVSQIPHDDNDVAIARSIIALGTMMQFIVLAEGVETQAQRDFLLANGCHQAQGYWFSKPLPADEITPLLPVA